MVLEGVRTASRPNGHALVRYSLRSANGPGALYQPARPVIVGLGGASGRSDGGLKGRREGVQGSLGVFRATPLNQRTMFIFIAKERYDGHPPHIPTRVP